MKPRKLSRCIASAICFIWFGVHVARSTLTTMNSSELEDERQLGDILKLLHRACLYLRRIEECDYLITDPMHHISKKTREG